MAKSSKSSSTSARSSKQQPPPPQSWQDKLRSLFGREIDPSTGKRRRVSRKERDDRRTRNLFIAFGVLGIGAILLLSGAAMNEYFLKPRKVLATVEGTDITRKDYWKYRQHTLANQVLQYRQYATMLTGQQQQQYLAMAQQAQIQLDDTWGSTSVDDATLSRMVDDLVIVESLDTLGLSISDQQVDDFIAEQFSGLNAPVFSPTPTQTLIPERAEWATQTAVAEAGSPEAVEGSPEAIDGSPVAVDGSPAASGSPAAVSGTPAAESASPQATDGSPEAIDSNAGSPIPMASPAEGTPQPTATIGPEDARATSTANFDLYQDEILDLSHMSVSDYRRLVAEPTLARQMVNNYFVQEVGQSAEQVHARHILVGTQELADSLYGQLQEDPDLFETLAEEASVDTSTAPNGGDLGWFPRGIMVAGFEEVAFSLTPGEISQPVQTQFGWHIIQVIDHADDRALTDAQIQQASQANSERWLETQFDALDVSSSVEPTPTQSIEQFVAPADAPHVPTTAPEPTPAASPAGAASPVPAASPTGS
ncbi:MAG: peptidylprolyl isomerase [Thermomicrobiales bacterium]|jgi:parvulin-like peptidyl-prolyl isomerase|nr:peptidylprolyl isomerase [Thermomicrobiales bacterium]